MQDNIYLPLTGLLTDLTYLSYWLKIIVKLSKLCTIYFMPINLMKFHDTMHRIIIS